MWCGLFMLGQRPLPELELATISATSVSRPISWKPSRPSMAGRSNTRARWARPACKAPAHLPGCCQHFTGSAGNFAHQPVQRFAPVRGQQFRGAMASVSLSSSPACSAWACCQFSKAATARPAGAPPVSSARRRRLNGPASAAVKQLQFQLCLQLGNGHADGRGHTPQLACSR